MKIDEVERGSITIFKIQEEVLHKRGGEELREAVELFVASGRKNLILDLKEVSFVDGCGLGEIVRAYTTVVRRGEGADLKLLKINRKLYEVLEITKLTKVFSIFDNENEAVASFEEGDVISNYDCEGSCPVCRIGEVDNHRCSRCEVEFCPDCYGIANKIKSENVLPCTCKKKEDRDAETLF